ncbi:MAG: DNA alkylation repair protein [Erysipelotrichaceae bacterium]|nr:DNA alkylation repair protein [Erysipelotrichaceae bacterium]
MYKTLKTFLKENSEEEYRKFSLKLMKTGYPVYGIRSARIRNFSKELSKTVTDPDSIEPLSHEEILIRGYLISYVKRDFKEYRKLSHEHLSYLDNWSTCDSFVSGAKWIKKYKDEYYKDILKYTKSNKEYYQRYGLVVLLSYYMEDKYINDILDIVRDTDYHNRYYDEMAGAWLLSYCFMYYFDKTYEYVLNNRINISVCKKGIQKGLDSYRISDNNKNLLRALRKEI